MLRAAIVLLVAVIQGSAWAQAPSAEKIYESLSPGVYFVWGLDANDQRLSQGSGVVVAPGKVVTGCQPIDKARQVFIQRDDEIHVARLELADTARDLCQFAVKSLGQRGVPMGSARELRVGQKVYALANARGAEVAIGEGMVSSLRVEGKESMLQATAPVAPGVAGVALFDSMGKLVGITTSQQGVQGNLNLAAPVEWIGEMGPRAKAAADAKQAAAAAALAARTVGGVVLAPGVPPPGATFQYRYVDRAFGGRQATFNISVSGVDGTVVREALLVEGQSGQVHTAVTAGDPRFIERMLPDGVQLSEFSPYWLAAKEPERGNWLNIAGMSTDARPWRISGRVMGWENITVPAGTFKALKVRVSGMRDADLSRDPRLGVHEGREFEYTAWYAEETRRVVKMEKMMRATSRISVANETMELVKYTPR